MNMGFETKLALPSPTIIQITSFLCFYNYDKNEDYDFLSFLFFFFLFFQY